MLTDEIREKLRAALRTHRWEEAERIIEELPPHLKDTEEFNYYKGVLLLGRGEEEEAKALLKKAMTAAEEQNRFSLAMSAAARLSAVDPDDINVRMRRADLYIAMGLKSAAYEYLLREFDFYRRRNDRHAISLIVKKIISVDEGNLDLALKMAKILAHLEQREEVRRVVESAIFNLQGQGKYDEAAQIQKEYGKLYEEP